MFNWFKKAEQISGTSKFVKDGQGASEDDFQHLTTATRRSMARRPPSFTELLRLCSRSRQFQRKHSH